MTLHSRIAQATSLPDPANLGAWCQLIDRRLCADTNPIAWSAATAIIRDMTDNGGTLVRSDGDRVTLTFGNVTAQLTARCDVTVLRRWQQCAQARLREQARGRR